MPVVVHPVDSIEYWVFGGFQSPKPNPDEHWIQPIEVSQLGQPTVHLEPAASQSLYPTRPLPHAGHAPRQQPLHDGGTQTSHLQRFVDRLDRAADQAHADQRSCIKRRVFQRLLNTGLVV
jgi:hypothetical protein